MGSVEWDVLNSHFRVQPPTTIVGLRLRFGVLTKITVKIAVH